MRAIVGVLLVGLPVAGLTQSQVQSQTGAAGQSSEVTLDDLQNVTIQVAWTTASRIRVSNAELPGGKSTRLEVNIGPGAAIRGVSRETGWSDTPVGRKTNQMTRGFTGTLGVPGKNKDGSSTILWLFEAGTLTRLNVIEVGGAKLKIDFKKGAAGMSCSASVILVREIGAGNRVDKSPAGGKVEILSARLTGTPSCRVVARGSS